jgi:aminoglycoside/choline kinase family phosphotransferase
MVGDGFSFLCATFYRWAQLFPALCPKLVGAPKVLGVGDLHVENYGTWRDAEGRLVWDINDFDEACPLPYTNDLVRLATSGWLAVEAETLVIRRDCLQYDLRRVLCGAGDRWSAASSLRTQPLAARRGYKPIARSHEVLAEAGGPASRA